MPLDRAIEALIERANRKAVMPEQARAPEVLTDLLGRIGDDAEDDTAPSGGDAGSLDEVTYAVPTEVARILAPYESHWDYFGLYEDFMAFLGKDPANPTGGYPGWMKKWHEPGDSVPGPVQKLFDAYDASYNDAPADDGAAEAPDTTQDPGTDPAPEQPADTGSETGAETGTDTGQTGDAPAPETGSQTGDVTDPAPDTGTDTGAEAGTDTSTPPETDAGTDAPDPGSDRVFGWIDEKTYLSGGDTPDGFNIELVFQDGYTQAMKDAVAQAAETLSDLITGDLTDFNGIDDVRIKALTGDLSSFAMGGVSQIRPEDSLTAEGWISFDLDRVATLLNYKVMDDMAIHEMIHAFGFGSGLAAYDLTDTIGGTTRFTGATAIDVYNTQFSNLAANDPYADQGVPMEGAHWDESDFGNEIMTPTLSTSNIISDLTLAALEDMGYETVYPDEEEEQQETLFF